jgi:Ca2+-binding EF-hand superfamily protein
MAPSCCLAFLPCLHQQEQPQEGAARVPKDKTNEAEDVLLDDESRAALEAFAKYDMDNSGEISLSEFTAMLEKSLPGRYNRRQIRAYFNAADTNRNKSISSEEFVKWILKKN